MGSQQPKARHSRGIRNPIAQKDHIDAIAVRSANSRKQTKF
jgi:hypothetical protein